MFYFFLFQISDPSSSPTPYKSYIENLLNYSKDFQDTVLKSSCHWIPDTPYAGDITHLTDTNPETKKKYDKFNQGYVDRRAGLKLGGWQEFNIMLPSDIVTCQRYLPPSYVVEVILHRMTDDFLIICGEGNTETEYKIELDNIHLTVDRYAVSPSVQSAYANGLKRSLKPSIPMSRNYIKAYPKQATQTDLGETMCFIMI